VEVLHYICNVGLLLFIEGTGKVIGKIFPDGNTAMKYQNS